MFEHVIGHNRLRDQLSQCIKTGQLHQSYVFTGPEHIGKMTIIQEMASWLRTGEVFRKDSVFARQFAVGQGPNFLGFLDDGESLKVEQVRLINEFAAHRTADREWSICVIEHLERMTRSAANAFLKVLEEPSDRLVFLMTTRHEHKLLPTIRSRVQLLRCTTGPASELKKTLEQRVKNPLLVEELIMLSVGRLGLALAMIDDEALLERMRKLSDFAMIVGDDDVVDRFTLAEHLTKEEYSGADLAQFLVYLGLKFRHHGLQENIPQLERVQRLKQLFQDTQVNKRLWLEELFLNL
jgi:DNA polymerase-3 subunit delta'